MRDIIIYFVTGMFHLKNQYKIYLLFGNEFYLQNLLLYLTMYLFVKKNFEIHL